MKRIFYFGLFCALTTTAAFVFYVFALEIPDINNFNERRVAQSTKIYDRTGEILLYDIHGEENRTLISFEEIPQHVKNATLALEDTSFYSHKGVRPLSTLRAIFKNIFAGSSEGGSTITQQLVKNTLLSNEKTILRKVKEWVLSLKLERSLGKNEILSLYLNQIPYGSGAYGIESAAQTFFKKKAKELSLLETAYLVSLPKAPSYYSPYGKHRDELDTRAGFALLRMKDTGFLTKNEYETARTQKADFAPPKKQGISAPHFVLEVKEELNKMFGEDAIERNGLKVTTTLDADLQQKAEEVVLKYSESNLKNFNANNASVVAVDPKTGDVLAMLGSKNYFEKPAPEGCTPGISCAFDPQVNVSVRYRQPGSALKPFVYATAFKKGLTPETVVFDLQTEFNPSCNPDGTPAPGGDAEKCYHPVNFDDKFRGPVSLRESLAQSLNIPSVKVLYIAGLNESLDTAKDFGISTLNDPARYGLTLVLGGGEVSLLELTSAFGVFANDGVKNNHRYILKIEDSNGKIIFENQYSPAEVIEKNIARTINDILSDNKSRTPAFGEHSALYFPGRQVAAKTGTTNNYRDAWVLGYTPQLAVGAWAGNNDNTEMEKKVAGFIVAPFWHEIMDYALSRVPSENFISPDKLLAEKPILRGEWKGGKEYIIDKISGKLATEYTPKETQEKKVIQEIHSELFWIDKSNSQGPSPEDPLLDAQFKNWEHTVKAWAESQKLFDQNESIIPTEKDNVHLPEKFPQISEINIIPQKDTYKNGDSVVFIPKITNTYPITQVDYFLDSEYIGSSNKNNFEIKTTIQNSEEKNQINLKIKIYDSVRNSIEKEISIPLS
ncbi:MAG: transglycosylase domain-containing protein [Patescibacteria group bacterium]